MKILLINNEFPPIGGGGSILTKYVAKDLVILGHEVHLITSSYKKLPKYEEIDGVKIHRVPTIRLKADYCSLWELLIFSVSAVVYSMRFVSKYRPDLVQAYFAVPAGGVAYIINLIYKVPYYIYLGGSDVPGANPYRYKYLYPFLTPLIRLFWSRAKVVTAASRGLAKFAKKADPNIELKVIPNGVDTTYFKPKRKNNKVLKILGVGRLMPRKGYQFVIQALPEVVAKTKRKFVFELVGGGDYQENLSILAQKEGVSKHVKFIGSSTYQNLRNIYRNSDIFVHPSLAEGMPLALLEAMASGLPSISTKVAGNEELIHDGRNGFLHKPTDVDGIAKSLIKLINKPNLRKKMSRESAKIAKGYDWKMIAEAYHEIYLRT